MITTIDEAITKLREHDAQCAKLVCRECDLHADVADMLVLMRRLLTGVGEEPVNRGLFSADDREALAALLAPQDESVRDSSTTED